jgi:hypothetical protein
LRVPRPSLVWWHHYNRETRRHSSISKLHGACCYSRKSSPSSRREHYIQSLNHPLLFQSKMEKTR